MIAPLAEGGRILRDERYIDAARRAAGFILDRMRRDDGRLFIPTRMARPSSTLISTTMPA